MRKIVLLFLPLVLFLMSCGKDYTNEYVVADEFEPRIEVVNNLFTRMATQVDSSNIQLECIKMIMPFGLKLADGSTKQLNNNDDLEQIANNDSLEVLDFVYPLNVEINGTISQINSLEEFSIAFTSCLPDFEWGDEDFPAYIINQENSCYELVYPLVVKDEAGNKITVADEFNFSALITDQNKLYFFDWPIQILDGDQQIQAINNFNELSQAMINCNPIEVGNFDGKYIACLELIFPLSILVENAVVFVNDEIAFQDYLFSGEITDFSFPIMVKTPNGEEVSIASNEALGLLIENECFQLSGSNLDKLLLNSYDFTMRECYFLQFPLKCIADSAQVVNQDLNELLENYNQYPTMDLVFPVSVKDYKTNNLVIFTKEEELDIFINDCD